MAKIIAEEGQTLLGWRDIPTDNSSLGETARAAEPFMCQVFIARNAKLNERMAFERKLYVIRKRAEQRIRYAGTVAGGKWFYVSSLSCRTVVYKGMLMPEQVGKYFPDLADSDMDHRPGAGAFALFHEHVPELGPQPSVSLHRAQRRNQHAARQHQLDACRARRIFESDLFGDDIKKILPIINTDGSDSAMFDNCLELLRPRRPLDLPHAMMMMIPEPWTNHESMSPEKKAFYEYHSCLMEPWDGPASIAFTDGNRIGACLDRNGLRPSRYYVTKDDLVIMASEVGVLDIAARARRCTKAACNRAACS